MTCPYCWGSHGCDLKAGHDGDHQCVTFDMHGWGPVCSSRPRGHADVFHAATDKPEVIR